MCVGQQFLNTPYYKDSSKDDFIISSPRHNDRATMLYRALIPDQENQSFYNTTYARERSQYIGFIVFSITMGLIIKSINLPHDSNPDHRLLVARDKS